MRRKEGSLVPLEVSILEAGLDLTRRGTPEAHGFMLARELRDRQGAKRLTAYGTLYKALERLQQRGYLTSRWEDPNHAAEAGRPRRRFYRLTIVGEKALVDALAADSTPGLRRTAAAVRT